MAWPSRIPPDDYDPHQRYVCRAVAFDKATISHVGASTPSSHHRGCGSNTVLREETEGVSARARAAR
jgi:hypothetical protein